MPKDSQKTSPKPLYESRMHPYADNSVQKNPKKLSESEEDWKDAKCVICMEPPHNPVLLLCSSHEIGCRPYMCYTSSLLSNCLNQFRDKSSSSVGKFCPLCRGCIKGEEVKCKAMGYMNSIKRSCSHEGCEFFGNYLELVEHSRTVHVISSGTNDVVRSNQMGHVVERVDDVAVSRPASGGRRTARIRVGWQPRRQLARRDFYPIALSNN